MCVSVCKCVYAYVRACVCNCACMLAFLLRVSSQPFCNDCAARRKPAPARFNCDSGDGECRCLPLCATHATLHRGWGHALSPLDGKFAPPPATVFGVTQCPKPEHAGIKGEITHYCTQCKQLVCIRCGQDDHQAAGHKIVPLAKACANAVAALAAASTELLQGVAHHRAVLDQGLVEQQAIIANHDETMKAAKMRAAVLVAQLNAELDSALTDAVIARDAKLSQVAAKIAHARSAVVTLTTMQACAMAASTPSRVRTPCRCSRAWSGSCRWPATGPYPR